MAITSAYNFVPLFPSVYIPKWGDKVNLDIPFEDGEDGVIEVELKNISPLFVRNGHASDTDEVYSSHVIDPTTGEKQYFIPGTTIKGCIRNVMEVLSFARMSRYDNDSFGMARCFNGNLADNKRYMNAMNGDVFCGWISKDSEEKYWLTPCIGFPERIHHDDIRKIFPSFYVGKNQESAQNKQESVFIDNDYARISVEQNDLDYVPKGKYDLVCTGYMHKKEHEYLFPAQHGNAMPVSEELFMQFDSIHRHTEYYGGKSGTDGFLYKRLEEGKAIPVFYKMKNGQLDSMGITRMYRLPYQNNIEKAVLNAQPESTKQGKDLPEVIFGYADKDSALKGRVQFGHAFAENPINDDDCIFVEGILGEPRPSYYPLYLSQSGNSFSSYDTSGVKVAGRKRYRIHAGESTTSLSQGNGNVKLMTKFRPLPSGNSFHCRIVVHNLKKIEIGALLSALTFNDTSGAFHNLGMAKPFGYGKCSLEVKNLKGFAYDKETYLQAFESEISAFLYNANRSTFAQNESVNALIAIASEEHNDEELAVMDMTACEENKKTFSTLKEPLKKINIHIDESVLALNEKLAKYEQKVTEILALYKSDIIAATKALGSLKEEMIRLNLPTTLAENALAELLNPIAKGPSATINELPLAEDLDYTRIPNPKTFIGRCKKRKEELSTPEAIEIVRLWMKNFYEKASSKDKKNFKDAGKWKDLPISQEIIQMWIDEFLH